MNWRSRASAVIEGVYRAVAPTLADKQKYILLLDVNGNLKVRNAGPMGSDGTVVPMGAALVKTFAAKNTAGKLRYIEGWATNALADVRYLILIDKAGAVAANDPAVFSYPLPGSSNNLFPIVLPFPDMPFANGIKIAISTTPFIYTAPVADELAIGAIVV